MTDPSANVRRGDCGPAVEEIQSWLNGKLPPDQQVAVDGRFGAATERAIKAFQASVGLTADGIVGPQTWVALQSDDYDPSEA